MKVNGIHHVSALTADAQKNLDFYKKVLGLKLVKKSVNRMNRQCIICSTEMKWQIRELS